MARLSIPAWIRGALFGDTVVTQTQSTTLGGRLRQLLGRNGVYYVIASGFAVLVILWCWLLRNRRRIPGYVGHNQATTALRNFRSEEHTSELQSLMRISYAVFCLKKKK